MKKIIILLMTAGIMLTGCSTKDTALKTINSTDKTAKISEIEVKPVSDSSEEESACREINTENKDGFSEGYGIKVLEEKQYTWQEYTITLPEEWVGRCIMEENPYGFSIYQKASYEKDITLGYICGFFRTQEPVEYDHRKTVIAYTEDGVLYYLIQPADVPCDTEDDMIAGEYIRMCQQVPQLKTSLQINVSGIHGNADEFLMRGQVKTPLPISFNIMVHCSASDRFQAFRLTK